MRSIFFIITIVCFIGCQGNVPPKNEVITNTKEEPLYVLVFSVVSDEYSMPDQVKYSRAFDPVYNNELEFNPPVNLIAQAKAAISTDEFISLNKIDPKSTWIMLCLYNKKTQGILTCSKYNET